VQLLTIQRRLKDLGVKVPERTLRDWAGAGIIAGSQSAPPNPPGRPKKGTEDKMAKPGPRREWPVEAVYEAAACWAIKYLTDPGTEPEYREITKLKVLTYEFFKNAYAIDWWQDYVSSYDIDPLFVVYIAAYEKAVANCKIRQRVKVKYHVMSKMNCNRIDGFKRFYPVVGVELEKSNGDCDYLTWDYVEPWEYIDPRTDQPYEIVRDENGCSKFVKQPPLGQRFLPYKIKKSRYALEQF